MLNSLPRLIASGHTPRAAVVIILGLFLGIASLWYTPQWVLFVLVGVGALVAIARRPALGLLVIVVITSGLIDSDKLPFVTLGPISFHVTDILLLFLLFLAFIRALVIPGHRWIRTPLDVPMLLWFGAILVSAALALVYPSLTISWVFRRLRPLAYYLSFFCVTNLIRDKRQLLNLIGGLILIAVVASLAMVIQVAFPSLHLIKSESSELVTAGVTFSGVSRIFFGADRLIYPLFLVTIAGLAYRPRWPSPSALYVVAAILGAGLVLTFQRNYWATIFVMIAILYMRASRPQRARLMYLAVGSVILVSLAAMLPNSPINRYMNATADRLIRGLQPDTLTQDNSTQWRVMETSYAIKSIAENPILGVGLANFYRPYLEGPFGDGRFSELPGIGLRWFLHNTYLWIWADMGLPGLLAFLWLLMRVVNRGRRFGSQREDPLLRALTEGIALSTLGYSISNLVTPIFVQGWALVVFPILFGINEVVFRWDRAATLAQSDPSAR